MTTKTLPAQLESSSRPKAVRFAYLDGIRGLASLYVLLHHVWGELAWSPLAEKLPLLFDWRGQWLAYGHFAVVVFIVLSGYTLMLPIARAAQGHLNGSFLAYVKRRARRILPPYYASLTVYL